jgi:hypothetical protein
MGGPEDRIALGWIDMPPELRAIHERWRDAGDDALIFSQPGPNDVSLRVVLIRVPREAARALGVNDLLGDIQSVMHERSREIPESRSST